MRPTNKFTANEAADLYYLYGINTDTPTKFNYSK
jgi:hypothetical protein